jgi:hypothetical protein
MSHDPTPLPYTDTKPVGAADFYLAINATFRFIHNQLGRSGLHAYWTAMGTSYFAPVSRRWQSGGLAAIADYWRAFFAAEPQAEVRVEQEDDRVRLTVHRCPAIHHLREHQREIVPYFCQHCYFIGEAMARPAGFSLRVEGGNGACRQTFLRPSPTTPPQELSLIEEVRC